MTNVTMQSSRERTVFSISGVESTGYPTIGRNIS